MSIHDGHRERVKRRFIEQGIDGFEDHQALELLLFYALPRGDVNPLAHRLIDAFGSLDAVLDAPREELLAIEGVGENTATLLNLVPQMLRKYMVARTAANTVLGSTKQAGKFMAARLFGECEEVVYMACLDAKCKLINCRCLCRGNVNSAGISVRKIVEIALNSKATNVVLAHNHPSGIALPSREDEITTEKIRAALRAVEIRLVDHIVVADGDFVSMADNGFFI